MALNQRLKTSAVALYSPFLHPWTGISRIHQRLTLRFEAGFNVHRFQRPCAWGAFITLYTLLTAPTMFTLASAAYLMLAPLCLKSSMLPFCPLMDANKYHEVPTFATINTIKRTNSRDLILTDRKKVLPINQNTSILGLGPNFPKHSVSCKITLTTSGKERSYIDTFCKGSR